MKFATEFASVSKGTLTFEADADGIIDIPDLHVHEFADSIGSILHPVPNDPAANGAVAKPDAPVKKRK